MNFETTLRQCLTYVVFILGGVSVGSFLSAAGAYIIAGENPVGARCLVVALVSLFASLILIAILLPPTEDVDEDDTESTE
jgi:hypothetical protein